MGKGSKSGRARRDAQITRDFFKASTSSRALPAVSNSSTDPPPSSHDGVLPLPAMGNSNSLPLKANPKPNLDSTSEVIDTLSTPYPVSYSDVHLPPASLDKIKSLAENVPASSSTQPPPPPPPPPRSQTENGPDSSAPPKHPQHPPDYEFLAAAAECASFTRSLTEAAKALAEMYTTSEVLSTHFDFKASSPAASKTIQTRRKAFPSPSGVRTPALAPLPKPAYREPSTRSDLQPIECSCPSECSWQCPECVYMQLNGFKFVRLPKEPTKGEDGVQEDVKGKEKALVKGRRLKDKLLASPEGGLQFFAFLVNEWTFASPDRLTKNNIKEFAKYLRFAYPARQIDTSETKCDTCIGDDGDLKTLNRQVRYWKTAGVVAGSAVVFSKDIVVWINYMSLIRHSFLKKIRPFIIQNNEWEPIWFHDKNGDLDKLYEDVAYALIRTMLFSKIRQTPLETVDAMLFSLAEKSMVGVFVDMYRKQDKMKRREGTLHHWKKGKMSNGPEGKVVGELIEGAEDGDADGDA